MSTHVETELRDVTLDEPAQMDPKMGIDNVAFEDCGQIEHKDTEEIFREPKDNLLKKYKWQLEGMNLVTLSVIILSTAITISLILNIIFGNPQVMPHGAVGVDNDLCGRVGINILQKQKGNAVDAVVATILCLTVTRPDVASLAGCGAILVRDRNKQTSYPFDFLCPASHLLNTTNFPSKSHPATLVGIPGLIKGLASVHQQFGQKNWADLFHGAIEACESGFNPDKILVDTAIQYNISKDGRVGPIVSKLLSGSSTYTPPINLCNTLKNFADFGPDYLYATSLDNTQILPLIGGIVTYMKEKGVSWSIEDLQNYTVQRPQPLKMGFAGFTLESFPAPVVGGPLLLLLLGGLDLKDTLAPLDHAALSRGDPTVTGTYLHRLIELAKLTKYAVSTLGDIYDPAISAKATKTQTDLFSIKDREASMGVLSDTSSIPNLKSLLPDSEETVGISSTGVVVTDSVSLTVTANIFMGSPFGTEQILPNTGIHLNSALGLFALADPSSNTTILNVPAPGRRPLAPIGPLYMSTTHRKCGTRAGVTSSGGLWGVLDMAQVLSNALLFLRNVSCYSKVGMNTPDAAAASSTSLVPNDKPTAPVQSNPVSRSAYNPAADQKCLNSAQATHLERLYPVRPNSSSPTNTILMESTFPPILVSRLTSLGHSLKPVSSNQWPGRVFIAGWNGYEMISSGDDRCQSNSKSLYTY